MLQQTRVETVIPYFERWMARFPTLAILAQANQQDILKAWEGLGYYSRARNLHHAAKIIMEKYGGDLPKEVSALRSLPGIGSYTAGAIASIAFGADEPALDGNIRRVFARVFNIEHPLGSPQAENLFRNLTRAYLPPGRAGDYNQALMDLGSIVCTPRTPDCARCPLSTLCVAYTLCIQEKRPLRNPKAKVPKRIVSTVVIWRTDKVLIAQRPGNGLLGGLWEYPQGRMQTSPSGLQQSPDELRQEIFEDLGVDIQVGQLFGIYHHAFTHFRLTVQAFECCLINGNEPQPHKHCALAWVGVNELAGYPMGKIDRLISRKVEKNRAAGL
jgi:A/G-specific adenine glycosylase